MVVICRDDFIRILKQGSAYVLGTSTCNSGLLTNQGSTNRRYIRTQKYRQTLVDSIRSAIKNRVFNMNLETDIKLYTPTFVDTNPYAVMRNPLSDVRNEELVIKTDCIEIQTRDKDDSISVVTRALRGTSYKSDKCYRTSYYFGGNVKVGQSNYVYIAETIELPSTSAYSSVITYSPAFFVIYAVKTDKEVPIPCHSTPIGAKADEILRDEEEKSSAKNKSNARKRKAVKNEF